jgi:hypothetical protein
VHTIDDSNLLMNSAMAQLRREAMAARGGLSHLLDNFEDSRRPSSPSGLVSRFSLSYRWMDLNSSPWGAYGVVFIPLGSLGA